MSRGFEGYPPAEASFDFKRELRKWAPRIALLAMPFSCGGNERRELQKTAEDIHVSDRADTKVNTEGERPLAILETLEGGTLSHSTKELLDRAAQECREESPLLAVAVPETEGEFHEAEPQNVIQTLEEHAESHTHVPGGPMDPTKGSLTPKKSPLISSQKDHPHSTDGISGSRIFAEHPHMDTVVERQAGSVHAHAGLEQEADSGVHHRFEVFKGARVVGDYGEAIQEILELSGHAEIPVATPDGALVIGLEKRDREISGRNDMQAELEGKLSIDLDSLKPDASTYGYMDVGAGVEFSHHGEIWKVNVRAPLDEHRELWGELHTLEDNTGHESGKHDAEFSDHLDLGWTVFTGDKQGSLSAGYKQGEGYYKASLDLPLGTGDGSEEGHKLKLTLLASASSKNAGVFFTASGKF